MIGQLEAIHGRGDLWSRSISAARGYWLWGAVLLVGVVAFFGSPGSYVETSHALLHGLCAQTPSHTLMFDGKMLPFDSRMTGIYAGVIATLATIAWRRRFFWYGNPSKVVIALLAGLVALMAIDGFNSLFTDLGIWHPYAPSNAMRIVTGYGCGVALAVALAWLTASSTWRLGSSEPAIASTRDLVAPIAFLTPFGLALLLRPGWLHLPVTLLLVVSAWVTVSLLMLVVILLTFRIDARIRRFDQLRAPVAIAALVAISVMMGLAGFRFWIEHWFGISYAMM